MRASTLSNTGSLADGAGLTASVACAIHCAAMPLVIGYLPMLGLSWLADEAFHKVMAAVCFVLAVSAFWPGWRKHRSLAPALIGSAGVALLAVAAFGLEGSCCPTCTASGEAPPSELPPSEASCTDDQCPHCLAAQASDAPLPGAVSPSAPLAALDPPPATDAANQNALLALALPFITPAGGLLLVAGHLVNHRRSCRCQGDRCCLPDGGGGGEPSGA